MRGLTNCCFYPNVCSVLSTWGKNLYKIKKSNKVAFKHFFHPIAFECVCSHINFIILFIYTHKLFVRLFLFLWCTKLHPYGNNKRMAQHGLSWFQILFTKVRWMIVHRAAWSYWSDFFPIKISHKLQLNMKY